MEMKNRLQILEATTDIAAGKAATDAGGEEIYQKILTDFFESIEEKANCIAAYERKADIENYRIAVHSLKSVSKLVGAEQLSKRAEELEILARTEKQQVSMADITEKSRRIIQEKTSELLKLYRGYKEVLAPFVEVRKVFAEEREPITQKAFQQKMSVLQEAVQTFELDTAESIIRELGHYCYTEEYDNLVIKLDKAINDISYSECNQLIEGALQDMF